MWVLKNVELTPIIPPTISKHYISIFSQSYTMWDLDGKYFSSSSSSTPLSDIHAFKTAQKPIHEIVTFVLFHRLSYQ